MPKERTHEECFALYRKYADQPGLRGLVTYDKIVTLIGRPGNSSELSRYFKGYRKTAPGRVSGAEIYNAILQIASGKASV